MRMADFKREGSKGLEIVLFDWVIDLRWSLTLGHKKLDLWWGVTLMMKVSPQGFWTEARHLKTPKTFLTRTSLKQNVRNVTDLFIIHCLDFTVHLLRLMPPLILLGSILLFKFERIRTFRCRCTHHQFLIILVICLLTYLLHQPLS